MCAYTVTMYVGQIVAYLKLYLMLLQTVVMIDVGFGAKPW